MNYSLEDLIDIPLFQNLQEKLNLVYSFPSAIIDTNGKILTAVAWQDICTKFHRQHPECEKECIKSDQYINDHIHEAQPAVSYQCPHGLIDNASPIIMEGRHLGNFFTGQFFLEQPDKDFFRKQAKKYGFDEKEYLEAVDRVPVWTREKLERYLDFIKGFIEVIASLGLNQLKEKENSRLIKESEERYQAIIQSTSDWIWEVDPQGRYTFCSDKVEQILGYTPSEILGKTPFDLMPEEEVKRVKTIFKALVESKASLKDFENCYIHKNGNRVCLLTNGYPVFDESGILKAYQGADKDITERKKNEEALLKNQYYLSKAQELGKIGTWVLDISRNYLEWTEENYKIFGIPLGTPMNYELFLNCVHPEDRDFVDQSWRDAMQKKPYDVEHRLLLNGTTKWVRQKADIYFNNSGKATHAIGFTQDITDRKIAAQNLELVSERLKLATESAGIGIWELDLKQNKLVWDQAMFDLYGQSPEDFSGAYEAWSKGIHPDDLERVNQEVQDAIARRKEFHTNFRIVLPSGQLRIIEAHARVISGKDGSPSHMTGANWDITRVKENEIQLTAILENSPTGFAINNISTGEVRYVNKAFNEIYHIPFELCKDVTTFFNYVYGDQMELGQRILDDVRSGEPDRMKWETIPITDKETKEISYVSAGNIILEELDLMISTVWDVTERVENETKLLQALNTATEADRIKTIFLATMSHELRTPLNAIIGFSDIISEEYSMQEILDFTKIIHSNGNHLLRIVEDLFDISLIEAGEIRIRKKPENLIALLKEIERSVKIEQENLQKNQLELNLIYTEDHQNLLINTDGSKFKQIFLNLLKNALKFTSEGSVNFGFYLNKEEPVPVFTFFVRDTGPGIPQANQQFIFEIFRRGQDNNTKNNSGTGIGLTISKRLTELLGGQMWVESEVGKGSTFFFTLPFSQD